MIAAAFAAAGGASGPVMEAVLNDALRREPSWIPELTLVADLDGAIVGQLTCSYGVLTDDRGDRRRMAGVAPVSVAPNRQRTGIGSRLLHALVKAADAAGEPALVLLGSPDFYGRFGFVAAADIGIAAPDPLWGRHFQVRTLAAFDPSVVGEYRYAASFAGRWSERGGPSAVVPGPSSRGGRSPDCRSTGRGAAPD